VPGWLFGGCSGRQCADGRCDFFEDEGFRRCPFELSEGDLEDLLCFCILSAGYGG